ncbi:MAG TPA: cryptochrome/photolyase family protein [Nevskiaceae bacterium]|nr:cryptochrome/photolyase family protein [Nevskiaceae bacterium]
MLRRLVVVLGDQLDERSAAFDGFDPACDALWMAEVRAEATVVWSHQARIALFLAAMRHFAESRRALGWTVHYHRSGQAPGQTLDEALAVDLDRLKPAELCWVEPGEWRVAEALRGLAERRGQAYRVCEDRHFLCSRRDFEGWMQGRRQPRLEHFYRWMRGRTGWLVEPDGQPTGGAWNFDADNREAFPAGGPGLRPTPLAFAPEALTAEVLAEVATRYGDHPGSLAHFDWPVTRAQALAALADFIGHRLADFGRYQDAMWTGEPWPRTLLFHSRLSAALNLKLLDPREVCCAALEAYAEGRAPLAAVEGFVRQILGWREYVRGLYWHRMPAYLESNALDAQQPLPAFYWTGDTAMNCLRQTLGETLAHGYAHHIQRLMVTGLYALLLGVRPREVHEWYLAIYVDAVEWVELPNTLGMSQHADGGFMASKPYVASGKYIDRMSDYCGGCVYRPDRASGEGACPVSTLYWDFLDRHQTRFRGHPRLKMQVNNWLRKDEAERQAIRAAAADLRAEQARQAE